MRKRTVLGWRAWHNGLVLSRMDAPSWTVSVNVMAWTELTAELEKDVRDRMSENDDVELTENMEPIVSRSLSIPG